MPLDAHGFCRIKNVGTNVYVGRSLIEDGSTLPKSFIPLRPEEVKENAVFEYNLGFNPKLWEFHSLKSGVAKAEELPNGTPALRPAAFIEKYVERFDWEIDRDTDKTVIRDLQTRKVWTFPLVPDELGLRHVSLEDYIEGDPRQVWELEAFRKE